LYASMAMVVASLSETPFARTMMAASWAAMRSGLSILRISRPSGLFRLPLGRLIAVA